MLSLSDDSNHPDLTILDYLKINVTANCLGQPIKKDTPFMCTIVLPHENTNDADGHSHKLPTMKPLTFNQL